MLLPCPVVLFIFLSTFMMTTTVSMLYLNFSTSNVFLFLGGGGVGKGGEEGGSCEGGLPLN